MTQETLIELKKDYPTAPEPNLQKYVTSVGNRILRANHLIGNPYTYTFTVVNVSEANAFALPAGTIFVTAPLIAMSESEAELAGVLGHEIGHVKARHVAERLERAKHTTASSWFYGATGGLVGGAAGFGVGRLLCRSGDTGCLAGATALGAAAGIGGGLLFKKYKFMANSREDEMEADRIGFQLATTAGYAPEHVGDFYAKLLQNEERGKKGGSGAISSLSDAMSTHPPSSDRIHQMQELLREQQAGSHRPSARPVVSTHDFERARLLAQNILKGNR